jgi:hypothetical protein
MKFKPAVRSRHRQNRTNMTIIMRAFYGCILLVVLLTVSFGSHTDKPENENNIVPSPNAASSKLGMQPKNTPANSFIRSSTILKLPNGGGENKKSLEYVHCGEKNSTGPKRMEIILLHGAKFTKEDWVTSGILDRICLYKRTSAVAIDLSVRADGKGFRDAVSGLVDEGILSGDPVTVISPSASGKAIVSLGSEVFADGGLESLIKFWVPVASPAVLSANDSDLKTFPKAGIKILAIHGNNDSMGKRVTKKLEDVTGAKGVELSGGHPVYLDSPREFVETVLTFLNGQLSES